MFLKTFIKELQDLYDNYDPKIKEIYGEPIIYFESFEKADKGYQFKGLSHNVDLPMDETGNFRLIVK
jgi:hypothetical protein